MLSAVTGRAVGSVRATCAPTVQLLVAAACCDNRSFHSSASSQQVADPAVDAEEEEGAGAGRGRGARRGGGRPQMTRRVGRPYLDPKAPRMLEHVRNDPHNAKWGGLIDIIEHAAYCDGQREEDEDGFFFDNTRAAYDSDCDGDPFTNGYLTEDEYEFPESYKPMPYIPGRVMDQIHFLHTAKGWPIARLSAKYGVEAARVSAIINLKATEGPYKAVGAYDERLDRQMEELYRNRFGSRRATDIGSSKPGELGQALEIINDDYTPDGAFPKADYSDRRGGLRIGHALPHLPVPAKADRTHGSRFMFKDISGKGLKGPQKRNPVLASDFDGAVRFASNRETLYRSWTPRHWSLRKVRGSKGMPYRDEDENVGPATFRLAP